MKIVFVSDIHLNLRKNYSFELNRFYQLADELANEEAEYLVLGGDIFDKANPNLDEISAFYSFISKIKNSYEEIIVISGNHEDLSNKETCFHKLPEIDFKYVDFTKEPLIIDKKNNWSFYFVSHHKIKEISEIEVSNRNNLLFSHIRANIGVVKAEAPLSKISKQFDYVILGDIHIPYKPYDNIEYCGSPYTIQYEPKRDTGYFVINTDKQLDVVFKPLNIPQKVKYDLTVEEYKEILPYLEKENLYKIVLHDEVQSLTDLKIPNNVSIVFSSIVNKAKLEEELVEIKRVGNINVIDTLIKLAENYETIDEDSFKKGIELIDEFKREYYG